MIILGDRYTFSSIDIKRLKRKCKKIQQISYKNMNADESIQTIEELLKTTQVSLIVLNTKIKLPHKFLTYLTQLELKGIKYITLEHFLEKYLNKCLIDVNAKSYNLLLEEIHTYTPFQYCQKRFIDFFAILTLFPFTFLAIIYSYFRIKKESPGPLFFKQKRVGLQEKEFTCIKLRSMHLDAERNGAKFATIFA